MADETIADDRTTQDKATDVATTARDEARGVADDARSEASAVVSEAGTQALALADEARSALRQQASDGTNRAAGTLDQIARRLRALADGDAEQAGDLQRYARDLGDRIGGAAGRLQERGLDGLVDDVQGFARRRPGMFLAVAAGAGFAAGRLFRGAKADAESSAPSSNGHTSGSGVATPGESEAGAGGAVANQGTVGPATTAIPPAGSASVPNEQQRGAELSGRRTTRDLADAGAGSAMPEGRTSPAPTPYGGTTSGTPEESR